jgi:homoserine kinase
MSLKIASAVAPASIANVAIGFDILGHAFGAAADMVTAVREPQKGVRLGTVTGLVSSLPADVQSNCALAAAAALLDAVKPSFGVRLLIDKGVPISAGMGGSAASAVAAAAAVNALLGAPFAAEELIPFALAGERVASDPPPWDNVIASLFGGLVLVAREEPALIQPLPVPAGIVAVLVHPKLEVETRKARALLRADVPMATVIEHVRRAAAFFVGCAAGNEDLLRVGLEDLLIEPQRLHLLPQLTEIRRAAIGAGALGCSFSGSGPSVFAWVPEERSSKVREAMVSVLRQARIPCTAYVAPIGSSGARVLGASERSAA